MKHLILCLAMIAGCTLIGAPATQSSASRHPAVVRCAVIGGMSQTGLWTAVGKRYEAATGNKIELVATGNKESIIPSFQRGECDLITMHASDEIINLVADGYALDAQPWARNDMVIVGPKDDPAKIHGMTDAAGALRKIADEKAWFIVHSSAGAQGVLHDVLDSSGITLDPEHTLTLFEDHNNRVLRITSEKNAYTLVGRIPFLTGKLPNKDLIVMVQGDPRLRRPFMVAVANPERFPDARVDAARQLATFLRSPETQSWLVEYGRGELDDRPLFFPARNAQNQQTEKR